MRIARFVVLSSAIVGGIAAKPLASLVSVVPVRQATATTSDAMQSMVDAERAFARRATEVGTRDGFLEFFAPDALALVPDAQSAVERLKAQPSRPFSEAALTWEPRAGDVSASGDFGWLTGPSTFVDRKAGTPPRYGNYLSVWRRSGDGPWRVYIDVGSPVREPAPFVPGVTTMALSNRYAGPPDAGDASSIAAADKVFNERFASAGLRSALEPVLAPGSRLHRRDLMPRVGREVILEGLGAEATARASCVTGGSGAARSSDLGYSFGVCTAEVASAPFSYIRIWARDAAAAWWLVVEAE